MNGKKVFYSEAAYAAGMVFLALGTALMERADFGMSMVVAPAYLLHLKLSQFFPWFSFGMAEYSLQAVLLLLLWAAVGSFRARYLLSFGTAVLYGLLLDCVIALLSPIPALGIGGRVLFFLAGMVLCSLGVAFLFHTYIAPEAYELFVKEVSGKYGTELGKTKTVYDCCSCAVAVLLSFAFFGFGHFEGVKLGTVFCALVNGSLIGFFSRKMEGHFRFRDAWHRSEKAEV